MVSAPGTMIPCATLAVGIGDGGKGGIEDRSMDEVGVGKGTAVVFSGVTGVRGLDVGELGAIFRRGSDMSVDELM